MQLPFAHLSENKATITRTSTGGRAHPLGEAGRPGRKGTIPVERVNELVAIVNYLDSENRQHKRYQPGGGSTFCNIYAHDYCYLADTFLPRVWWTDAALTRIQRGEPVKVRYSNTVRELNANALHDWLEDYGAVFGWQRVTDVDPLQRAANDGEICLIVAKRKDLNRSGHVVVVVPEHEELLAARTSQGEILRPLESQAGTKNFRFVVKHNRWWQNDQFSSYGFWRRS
jgi:hypothetical protein